MKILVSILHYNSQADTINCLNSLAKSDLDGIEIATHVLDNASKEPFVQENDYSKLNLVAYRLDENLGFTGGHNFIFKKAYDMDFDCLLLLNNDSIVTNDLLKGLIKELFKEKSVGAVVPKIYFTKGHEYHKDKYRDSEKGKVIWYAGGFMDWANVQSVHRGVDEVDHGQYDQVREIDFGTGACFLIKKETLLRTKLFDPRYFLYFEDADLSQKVIRHGYKILYIPHVYMWHNNAGSSGSGSSLHDYFLTRNRMLFGMKYAPIRTKIALIRESFRLVVSGRQWQKIGIRDYYLKKFGKGSFWNSK